jgi:hypothetical protein
MCWFWNQWIGVVNLDLNILCMVSGKQKTMVAIVGLVGLVKRF